MKKWILVINVLVTLNELNNFPWQIYYKVENPDITWFHYVFTCSAKPVGICGVSTVKHYNKMIIRWSHSLWAWLFFLTACAEYGSSLSHCFCYILSVNIPESFYLLTISLLLPQALCIFMPIIFFSPWDQSTSKYFFLYCCYNRLCRN